MAAASVADFQAAVQAARNSPQGTCESIPYEDLRDECASLRDSLQDACKEKPRTCEGLETRPLSEKIAGIEEKMKALKDSTPADDDDKKRIEDQISKLEEELEFTNKSRDTDMSDAGIRIDDGNKCLDVRNGYASVFNDAASKAKDESDSDVAELRNELLIYWEERGTAHDAETDKMKDAIKYCCQDVKCNSLN